MLHRVCYWNPNLSSDRTEPAPRKNPQRSVAVDHHVMTIREVPWQEKHLVLGSLLVRIGLGLGIRKLPIEADWQSQKTYLMLLLVYLVSDGIFGGLCTGADGRLAVLGLL